MCHLPVVQFVEARASMELTIKATKVEFPHQRLFTARKLVDKKFAMPP